MLFHILLTMSAFGLGIVASEAPGAGSFLQVHESVNVDAPPETVWKSVGNFNDVNWHPAVAKTELVSGKNNEGQAKRSLLLKDGARIVEQLREHDDVRRLQRYTIVESPLPVADYEATIKVAAGEGSTTVVSWQARFRRNQTAGGEMSDDALKQTFTRIFSDGLAGLKSGLETSR